MYTTHLEKFDSYNSILTVEEFKNDVDQGVLIDDDGYGYLVKDMYVCEDLEITPSMVNDIPSDAQFIVWFNR